jgi:hypothetical protein
MKVYQSPVPLHHHQVEPTNQVRESELSIVLRVLRRSFRTMPMTQNFTPSPLETAFSSRHILSRDLEDQDGGT